MNDTRKNRLRLLATGVALVSTTTLAEDPAPPTKPDRYVNSVKVEPVAPPRTNSPGPRRPPAVDAGVPAPIGPGPITPVLNSPNGPEGERQEPPKPPAQPPTVNSPPVKQPAKK